MIKIRLLSFYSEYDEYKTRYTLAALRLAAYICDVNNLDIRIIPILLESTNEELDKLIEELNVDGIDLLGMSALAWNWDKIKYISLRIKRTGNNCIQVGGPEVINRNIDDWVGDEFFVYGEGEIFTKELCKLISSKMKISNIREQKTIGNTVKKDGKYYANKDCKLTYTIPIYSKAFFEKVHIDKFEEEFIYYETTRGCPYNCGFCGYKFRDSILTFREDFIEEEIRYIGESKINKIFIIDPIIGGTREGGKRIFELFNRYSPQTAVMAYLRPEYLDVEYLELLGKSNIECLRLGVQTINENVPSWIRSNNIKIILQYLPRLSNTGIPWCVELIVGLPGDDMSGLSRTMEFIINKVKPTSIHAYHLMVLQETELYRMVNAQDKEWIHIDEINQKAIESYSYDAEELIEMIKYTSLITALYNSYEVKVEGKTYNNAPEFVEMNQMVQEHMKYFDDRDYLEYGECVTYWNNKVV